MEAEVPRLIHAVDIRSARRNLDDLRRYSDPTIWIKAIDRDLKAAFGTESVPGCYAALDETGRKTAYEMITMIVQLAGDELRKPLTDYLAKLLEDSKPVQTKAQKSVPLPGNRPGRLRGGRSVEKLARRRLMLRIAAGASPAKDATLA